LVMMSIMIYIQRLLVMLVWISAVTCLPSSVPHAWEEAAEEQCHCIPPLCPNSTGCLAGLVRDRCDCCLECGNIEGQPCDLDDSNNFYGRCGENLHCRVDIKDLGYGDIPEPQCVCQTQQALCGSDGKTYQNICKFKEAAHRNTSKELSIANDGPCQTVPQIKLPPQNQMNVTGKDVIFLCEVFSSPMALIEWKKDENELSLPGDDPHISVQSRGGPMKYELSSWLQIEGLTKEDVGTYHCVAHNKLGSVTAKASLIVF
uniref:Kazal type serine peptidase inhibitor domain 1 n=1 Tax=Latimeria chalumnae TaxID=7897 RepID=H3B7P9_LATCH